MSGLRILAVASEMFPLIKTGGLADVVGALPRALAALGIEVRTLVPGYPAVLSRLGQAHALATLDDLFGDRGELLTADLDGTQILVLEAPHLYDRPGGPYQAPGGHDWPDNARRFAALGWVASEIARGRLGDWRPDIVHAHDWQAGLAPAYPALASGPRPPTILTIHNIAFQGQFGAHLLPELRLPPQAWSVNGVEYYGGIGFLKAGLYYADRITTVSPTYAREIQTSAYGMGLEGLLRTRAADLTGIVNGIDETVWNPATDPHLPAPYTADDLAPRARNKAALRAQLGLEETDSPLFCVVSRLTWQKGMDLLIEALPDLVAQGAQLAVLGSDRDEYTNAMTGALERYPGRTAGAMRLDEPLSHLMQGGADAILVPSRFEPCGLTQLYGLRYGCVPVVARVGGLADTVVDANDAALGDGVATGVQFAPVTVEGLRDAIARAIELWRDRATWAAIQRRGMSRDVGWRARAKQYAALYHSLVPERGRLEHAA